MKFIHIADVHLGANPDLEYPWGADRKREIWNTFRRVIEETKREKADLLLIAGDLFHRQPLKKELKEVNGLFRSIPDTKVVLIAGNHDFIQKNSNYRTFSWASNVTGLWGRELEMAEFPEINTCVYGLSYWSREIREPLYEGIYSGKPAGFQILLAHGGDEKHIPIRREALGRLEFDYIALGHIHKPQVLIKDRAAYAGALEPIDRNDTGPHGYIQGEYNERGECRIEFRPLAARSYWDLEVSVPENSTWFELEDSIKKQIEARGSQNIYRLTLDGIREEGAALGTEHLKTLGNIVEIRTKFREEWGYDQLAKKYEGTFLSEYIRQFQGRELNETDKKALYYGVKALMETRRE